MPALPPDLYDALLQLCEGLPLPPNEREGLLRPALGDWPGLATFDWGGGADAFAARLLDSLPVAGLQNVLRALGRETGEADRYNDLGRRIHEASVQLATAGSTPGRSALSWSRFAKHRKAVAASRYGHLASAIAG